MMIILPLILFKIQVFEKSMTFRRQVTKDDGTTETVVIKQEVRFLLFTLRPEVQEYVLEQIYRQQSALGTEHTRHHICWGYAKRQLRTLHEKFRDVALNVEFQRVAFANDCDDGKKTYTCYSFMPDIILPYERYCRASFEIAHSFNLGNNDPNLQPPLLSNPNIVELASSPDWRYSVSIDNFQELADLFGASFFADDNLPEDFNRKCALFLKRLSSAEFPDAFSAKLDRYRLFIPYSDPVVACAVRAACAEMASSSPTAIERPGAVPGMHRDETLAETETETVAGTETETGAGTKTGTDTDLVPESESLAKAETETWTDAGSAPGTEPEDEDNFRLVDLALPDGNVDRTVLSDFMCKVVLPKAWLPEEPYRSGSADGTLTLLTEPLGRSNLSRKMAEFMQSEAQGWRLPTDMEIEQDVLRSGTSIVTQDWANRNSLKRPSAGHLDDAGSDAGSGSDPGSAAAPDSNPFRTFLDRLFLVGRYPAILLYYLLPASDSMNLFYSPGAFFLRIPNRNLLQDTS